MRNQIIINIREKPGRYGAPSRDSKFEEYIQHLLSRILQNYPTHEILLLPNHYFCFGGDDRVSMNRIKFRLNSPKIKVQNKPLSLVESMETIMQAAACIGMRYHSILFMSLLNGHCNILNYTDPSYGKISGFIQEFDRNGYWSDSRHVHVSQGEYNMCIASNLMDSKRYSPPLDELNVRFARIRNILKQLL
jgi:polysaccharide pyruvyl transferase WcaK-like protein